MRLSKIFLLSAAMLSFSGSAHADDDSNVLKITVPYMYKGKVYNYHQPSTVQPTRPNPLHIDIYKDRHRYDQFRAQEHNYNQ